MKLVFKFVLASHNPHFEREKSVGLCFLCDCETGEENGAFLALTDNIKSQMITECEDLLSHAASV